VIVFGRSGGSSIGAARKSSGMLQDQSEKITRTGKLQA
jgi:hypothetical protein